MLQYNDFCESESCNFSTNFNGNCISKEVLGFGMMVLQELTVS